VARIAAGWRQSITTSHSKEELFLATMQIPVPIHELVARLVAEGADGLGERLVRTMLAS